MIDTGKNKKNQETKRVREKKSRNKKADLQEEFVYLCIMQLAYTLGSVD
jgi:hypothetical protein